MTADLIGGMLVARLARWAQHVKLHRIVVRGIAQDELCQRFMRIPNVGLIAALTARTAIRRSGAIPRLVRRCRVFGLTSKRWQSGTSIDVQSRLNKAGDVGVRRAINEAAAVKMKRD